MALRRHMKNFVKNYSEAEIKVREATSNDPWGPPSSLMLEISDLTYNKISFSEIMSMIWDRMSDRGKNWRHVYKSLTLLDYLLKNGSQKVIQHCQEGSYNIQILKDFHHIDEAGKDQGFYVREKSKQVIALLTDKQQLHNERETARRTRHRTSYAMVLPPKTYGKNCSPAIPASDHVSDARPSENIPYFSLKASPATEQSHSVQMSGKAEIACETAAPSIITKKLSKDLIVFGEDEPSTFDVQAVYPPTTVSREELTTDIEAAATAHRNAKTAWSPAERLPAPQWDSSRKSKNSVVSRVTLKAPPKEETGANKVTETLFDLWLSPSEEFVPPKTKVSKSYLIRCSSESSVETIYRSPTLQAFDQRGDSIVTATKSTPASFMQFCGPCGSSLQNPDFSIQGNTQPADLSSHPSPRPESNSSAGTTFSFSTFSMSSPESVAPNTTTQTLPISPRGHSYAPSPRGRSSLFFKELKERIAHSFCQVSDTDEIENASILKLLPDNSEHAVKKGNCFRHITGHTSGGSLEKSLMHSTPSVPNPGTPSPASLPTSDPECCEQKGMVILEEIKNAVCGLREDFHSATQELHGIRSELITLSVSMQKMTAAQIVQGDSSQK